MSEFSSFKDMLDTGYRAVKSIQADESLTPDERKALVKLDPTVEQVQREIADIFAAEEAEVQRIRQALQDGQESK